MPEEALIPLHVLQAPACQSYTGLGDAEWRLMPQTGVHDSAGCTAVVPLYWGLRGP